jgi:hypothetical protein
MASEWSRALLGSRGRLLAVVGVLVLLVLVVPVVLVVLGLIVAAALSLVVGLAGFAALVLALLPGRRRWH